MSQWHCRIGDHQYGPLSTRELKVLADTGKLRPTDLLKKDGTTSWAHASAVRGLFAAHDHEPVKTVAPESAVRPHDSPHSEQTRTPESARPADSHPRRKLSTRDKLGVVAIGFSLVLIVAAIGYAIGRKPRGSIAVPPVSVATNAAGPRTSVPTPVKPSVETGAKVNAEAGSRSESQIAPPSAPSPAVPLAVARDQTADPTPADAVATNVPSPLTVPATTSGDVAPPTPATPSSPGNQTPPPEPTPVPAQTPVPTQAPASPPGNASSQPTAPVSPAEFPKQDPPAGFPRQDAAGGGGLALTPPEPAAPTKPPLGSEARTDASGPPDPRDDAYCQQVQQLFEQTRTLLTELRANQGEVRKIVNDCDQVKQTINTATVQIPQLMMRLNELNGPPLPGAAMVPLEQRAMLRRQLETQLNMLVMAKQDSEKRLGYELPRKMREAEGNVTQVLRKCDERLPQWIVLSDPFAEQSRAVHVRMAEMCTEFLAGERDFIAGYLLRGFARWHAGEADNAVKDLDHVVQGCEALQTVQVRSDGQAVPGGQGRKLTKNEQEVLAAALSGQAVWYAERKQEDQAKAKYGAASDLCPKSVQVSVFRGRANALLGKTRSAADDFLKATKLDGKEPAGFRELARLLATSPTLNEGKRAVEFGRTACELTHWKQWQCLDAYAIANAKNETFEEAIKWGQKTLEIAPSDARPELEQRLKLYQARVAPTNVKSR